MKNKIFALSLCAMFLFAGFAQAAPVFTDVPADRAEAPAIELMQALGIMQGVSEGQFAPEESLTRAQFAAISLELSGVAAADMDLEDPVFTDVDSSYWAAGAIQTAAKLGYITGNGDGAFSPETEITTMQALKILTHILGYAPFAELGGGYPSGYLKIASEQRLLNGVSIPANQGLTRAQAAVLIENALNTPMMLSSFGETYQYYTEKDQTLLYVRFETKQLKNVVVYANGTTTLSGGSSVGRNRISAGGEVFAVGNTPAEEYLGYSVSLYYKTDDDGTNQIIYVSKDNKRNNAYTVKTEDVTGYSAGKLYWQDGDKKRNKNLPASADILYNGKAAAFSESLFAGENGEITMIDNTGDDEIDVVMVRAYENMVIGSIDYTKYKVYDKYVSGVLLDFKELKEEQYKITDFGAQEPLMLEDLSEGDLISYFVSEDKSYIEIVRGTQIVTGTVEAMGDDQLTIGGKEYPISSYLGQKDQKIKNGDSGEFVLDVQGRIAKFTLEDGGAMRYGYVITMKKGDGVDSSYQMKILCDDGTIAIYSVADKLIVDRGTLSAPALEKRLTADGQFRMQLIRYRLNDNKIKEVDTAELSSEEDENSLVRGADKMLRKYKSYAKSFLLDFNITDGTKIFRVPDPEDESSADLLLEDKNFDCVGPSNFVHDRDYTVEGFDLEDGNVAKAAVIYMKGVEEVSAGSTLVLVDKVTSTINEDGVETDLLHCLANGKHTEYVAKEKGVLLAPELGRNVKRGDVIRLSTDKNNQITAVSVDLDITKLDKTQRAYKGTFMTDFYEFGGLVRNKGNGYFVVDGQRLYNNVVQEVSLAPSAGGYVYIYDSEADSIYNGSFDDVICGDTAETASYVLVRMSYETCKEVIVFK